MARKQTRHAVSLPDTMYKAAIERAEVLGIPLAQLVCKGLRAMGVRVDTDHRPLEDAKKASAARRTLDDVARERTAAPKEVTAPFCASCLKVRPPYKLVDGSAMCGVCSDEHPRSGRCSFGERSPVSKPAVRK